MGTEVFFPVEWPRRTTV